MQPGWQGLLHVDAVMTRLPRGCFNKKDPGFCVGRRIHYISATIHPLHASFSTPLLAKHLKIAPEARVVWSTYPNLTISICGGL